MALSQFSETPGEPGWVLFEKRSWKSATEQFLRSVKEKELDLARSFLEKQGSVDEARTACQAANREAGARYSTEKSFSFSVGHKKIVPKALVIKLLGNLDTFTKAGDVAFKGGPESVGSRVPCRRSFLTNLGGRRMGRCQIRAQPGKVRL